MIDKTQSNIYDVAVRAGVSKSTVSRVLNESERVKESTRRLVEEAMKELGYRPNSDARRLAGSTDNRIGLVLPFFEAMFSSFYVHEILRGVGEAVSERDAELLLHIQNVSQSTRAIERVLRGNGHLGGWVIADERVPAETLRHLQARGAPFVLLNRAVPLPGVSSATVDNRSGARLAVQHLIRLGHTRIATLTGALAQQPARERLEGFRDAMEVHALSVPEGYVVECDFQRDLALQATNHLMELPCPPTAVFVASDLMAAGVYEAANQAGVRIPDDLSVVGFDDDILAGQLAPKLTTVRQPLMEMARTAASWLLDHIEGRNGQALRHVVTPQLVMRESCVRVEGGPRDGS